MHPMQIRKAILLIVHTAGVGSYLNYSETQVRTMSHLLQIFLSVDTVLFLLDFLVL
jgi:hypothetical protein